MTLDGAMTETRRREFPVLVPDAHAIGMIATIRSLGRAGYPVHACASRPDALGLASRYATRGDPCPSYEDPRFLPWLSDYVRAHRIRAIIPSEGFLLAVRPVFDEFAALMPISRNSELVYGALSKAHVLARLLESAETSAHIPPTLIVVEGQPAPESSDLERLGPPLFLKGDGADARDGGANIVVRELTAEAALARLHALRARYTRVIVQGYVPGQGTGAYFLMRQGEIRQEFMNRCLHEVPHTGGLCSLRESWLHEAMLADARRKIHHLGWEGVAMLEYRWDPDSDRFWFIELNARFWAALHLALYAGVDFPLLLMDEFHGSGPRPQKPFPVGVQCRYTVPFEIGYVVSRWRDRSLPFWSRLASVAEWFALFLNPRIYSDLWFPKDRRLYWLQWRSFVRELVARPPR